jgi:hypothetical protein
MSSVCRFSFEIMRLTAIANRGFLCNQIPTANQKERLMVQVALAVGWYSTTVLPTTCYHHRENQGSEVPEEKHNWHIKVVVVYRTKTREKDTMRGSRYQEEVMSHDIPCYQRPILLHVSSH